MKIAKLIRAEIHGPSAELEQLRTPLAIYNPQYFALGLHSTQA